MRYSLTDFLTASQIKHSIEIYHKHRLTVSLHKELLDKVVNPNIKAINGITGQENNPDYLAYAIEYVLTMANCSGRKV